MARAGQNRGVLRRCGHPGAAGHGARGARERGADALGEPDGDAAGRALHRGAAGDEAARDAFGQALSRARRRAGPILRTADAFDCDGVFLVNACADPFNPKTARATMGAIFRREAYCAKPEEVLALLAGSAVPLYGTALRADTVPLAEADWTKAAVAIGSEGRGLSQQMLDACAKTLKIPMSERCESLNAAVAATVVLWEMYR